MNDAKPPIPAASAVQLDATLAADPNGDGVHWSLAAGSDLHVNLVHLDPRSRIAVHTNRDVDVVIIVLAGDGGLRLDGTDYNLGVHVLILVEKQTERSITAGPDGLTYLTVHRRREALTIASTPNTRG